MPSPAAKERLHTRSPRGELVAVLGMEEKEVLDAMLPRSKEYKRPPLGFYKMMILHHPAESLEEISLRPWVPMNQQEK
ncbi:hypothetical protein RHGRI_023368 [Rhododendron griersonianum]|uniref:Uncharacterized protein n=1 Tax=Rhododendron griersonianum TaxID=479676 RepID=A0AAV6J6L2_9ERIC|nr:hypothetical protein RHGRI_023368 [Rhododendron griersonianum]